MTSGPGWHPDPNNPNQNRWWDGTTWGQIQSPQPKSKKTGIKVVIITVGLMLVLAVFAIVAFGALIALVVRVSGPEPTRDLVRQTLFANNTEITLCEVREQQSRAEVLANVPLQSGERVTVYIDFLDGGEVITSGSSLLESESLSEGSTAVIVGQDAVDVSDLQCEITRVFLE